MANLFLIGAIYIMSKLYGGGGLWGAPSSLLVFGAQQAAFGGAQQVAFGGVQQVAFGVAQQAACFLLLRDGRLGSGKILGVFITFILKFKYFCASSRTVFNNSNHPK
ncbi:MAG TPA: hypothetical protein ENK85_04025 [Saprospiraceae bacterium]|nr:hypothetical protein [Saprospiraceae bacterium]